MQASFVDAAFDLGADRDSLHFPSTYVGVRCDCIDDAIAQAEVCAALGVECYLVDDDLIGALDALDDDQVFSGRWRIPASRLRDHAAALYTGAPLHYRFPDRLAPLGPRARGYLRKARRNSGALIGTPGGAGPDAHAHFTTALVRRGVNIIQLTDPDTGDKTQANRGLSRSYAPAYRLMTDLLEATGCDAMAYPCNTIHLKLDEYAPRRAKVLDIRHAALTVAAKAQAFCGAVILLGTRGSIECPVYDSVAAAMGVELLKPDDMMRALLMEAIGLVKGGRKAFAMTIVSDILRRCKAQFGAHPIILACTELPHAVDEQTSHSYCLVNATEALQEAVVAYAKGDVAIGGHKMS